MYCAPYVTLIIYWSFKVNTYVGSNFSLTISVYFLSHLQWLSWWIHREYTLKLNNPTFCWLQVEDIVKYSENGTPIKRMRRDKTTVHSKNIAGRSFWNEHQSLLKELGGFTKDVGKINSDYIRSFLFESKLMASTWIVIRIDGCHFHR